MGILLHCPRASQGLAYPSWHMDPFGLATQVLDLWHSPKRVLPTETLYPVTQVLTCSVGMPSGSGISANARHLKFTVFKV